MTKKYKFILISSSLIAPLAITSCMPNIIKEEKLVTIKKVEEKQHVMLLDDLVKVFFKGSSEAIINKFKEEQVPSDEWMGNFRVKIEEYEKLFWNRINDPKKRDQLDKEIADMINEKWYWYLSNLRKFEYNFNQIEDFFEKQAAKWNIKFNQEYLDNKVKMHEIFKKSNHYYPVSNQPVQIIALEDIHGETGGQYILKFNDQYFLPMDFEFKFRADGSKTVKVDIKNELFRFSTEKNVNLKTYNRTWHNFAYHSNLPELMQNETNTWQEFVKSNGYVMIYKITDFDKNKYLPGVI
ncbi:aromatic motif membrane protein [Mycoplasmopsis alligatoris]|uniref:Lipoprotein n=1 Tax=Mycoplasmopsis alligatoris A21JP2 TaxID=747682 RepID=D4XW91_9BACT|nr:aromatic motif membrane protein [Mycoplasmopsis alligatoris]EFF41396.1 hypothetical protein MALL_0754 [Mycoplasmopsis alligatoris A21JP2]